MSDVFSRKKRSWIMARISGSNTKPEIIVRKILYGMGYRYRLNVRKLPGTPDIVLSKQKKVIFVHGCFWHGHQACRKKALPKSNKAFWAQKIAGNKARDQRSKRQLRRLGWQALTIWECRTKDLEKVRNSLERFMVS
jgi:DNA mismatch endonuclease (patch repair protein)